MAEEVKITLRINPGLDAGEEFWTLLERDARSAPEAKGVFVFQLMDDGELVVPYDVGARFWRWASRRGGFSQEGPFGRGGIPAILFEPR